jgi:site-specific DNA-methyltransferase (adenine-specific)
MTTAGKRAPRNRTLTLSDEDRAMYRQELLTPDKPMVLDDFRNRVICGDLQKIVEFLPDGFVDLLILDPPYNLSKDFNGLKFANMSHFEYVEYLDSWLSGLLRLLKPTASIYLCGDWICSAAGFMVLSKYFTVRNRIVWQREKGRGARTNWKNCCEDIWFATVGKDYTFNLDAVKMKRRVLALYRQNGKPKDWVDSQDGKFRLTCPSNFWDDISIPYWSMPENTDHPTQKPEKLIAKLILASSNPGDVIFDPFGGSGTTAVTAYKLQRDFASVELNEEYCCWALARLKKASSDKRIQGYEDGVFYERNTRVTQHKA